MSDETDARVKGWMLKAFRDDDDDPKSTERRHLRICPTTFVDDIEGSSGSDDSGCEWADLVAMMACNCGRTYEFTYGKWGDIPSIIEELQREYEDAS